jgi:hypothetical protein
VTAKIYVLLKCQFGGEGCGLAALICVCVLVSNPEAGKHFLSAALAYLKMPFISVGSLLHLQPEIGVWICLKFISRNMCLKVM